ncbi:MAG: DNA primase catalytic subunit PriS [Hadesarchaea archaeon]|nr:DNA primase catalytic subunit PriS [Hadesarchaea archaeon]
MIKILEMREAKPEERQRYYNEEWSKEDLPEFVLHSLSLREFAFDHKGKGPNNRYNQFMTPEELTDFLKNKAPYAVYGSVALYERPSERKKWLKSEVVFDIDAKDLPIKSCDCTGGDVCEKCLNDARRVTKNFADTLRSNLALKNIHFVYSGRGFHIRVVDDSVMEMSRNERSQLVNYVTGGTIPSDLTMALGYSKIFRERLARTFENIDEEKFKDIGIRTKLRNKIKKEKEKVLRDIKKGEFKEIQDMKGMGSKSFKKFMNYLARLNSEFTDGKVTIDTKRILRLPSSLHSKVSRKCTLIKDIDSFSFNEAVPNFIREG